ncbi:hypothetical protein [Halalkalibacter sp. APA_J-10(15)]|uniref:hypothetical protein n=1 Tax=unclassified Halalkalibacter TaxID=2893063 RepID=UPI001FF3D0EE|nr:hypothetical protein [Halalkalibacter sp. APA_J-10(15)]MCK0472154.1 hypothetical protein [Halalkalibacter sp. APA_J-10(15)]
MRLKKVRNFTLITNNDISYNYRLGLPIEVYCIQSKKTIAFGRIAFFNNSVIIIHGHSYTRSSYLFFGVNHLEKSS